jgi:hypothetical protein
MSCSISGLTGSACSNARIDGEVTAQGGRSLIQQPTIRRREKELHVELERFSASEGKWPLSVRANCGMTRR